MQSSKTHALRYEKITRLLWRFFVPAYIGVFANALYNIVDRIFIGRQVGVDALSGLTVIFPILLIMMGIGMLIGIGTGVNVSISLGKDDQEGAQKVLGSGFFLMVLASILISIIGFSIKGKVLMSFGATEATIGYAEEYLNIILFGVIFQVVGFSLNNVIRSEGNARVAMYSMIISAASNILFDYIFVYLLDLGVKGAAWGTILAMIILDIWVFAHFQSKRSVVKLIFSEVKFHWSITKDILSVGMAPFFMQIAGSVVYLVYNRQLIIYGGDTAVGVLGVINSLATLAVMSMIAVNMAGQPIIGFNYGAKQMVRVRQTVTISIIGATTIGVIAWVFFEMWPSFFIRLFNTDNEELLSKGVQACRLFFMAFPVIGFQIVVSNYFQSTGKAAIAAVLSLLRQVVVLIPALFILPKYFGLSGVWISSPISDFISGIITLIFFIYEWPRLTGKK